MIELIIPGFGPLGLSHLVSDYNGTIAVDGALIPGIREKLNVLDDMLDVQLLRLALVG